MKKLILLLIPIGLGLAAYYFYSEYNRKPAAMTELKSVNVFTPEELYSEFKNNEASSNEKYLNKPIEVIGKAIAVNKGDDGVTTVTIDSGDPMGVISCEVANTELQKTAIIAAYLWFTFLFLVFSFSFFHLVLFKHRINTFQKMQRFIFFQIQKWKKLKGRIIKLCVY